MCSCRHVESPSCFWDDVSIIPFMSCGLGRDQMNYENLRGCCNSPYWVTHIEPVIHVWLCITKRFILLILVFEINVKNFQLIFIYKFLEFQTFHGCISAINDTRELLDGSLERSFCLLQHSIRNFVSTKWILLFCRATYVKYGQMQNLPL